MASTFVQFSRPFIKPHADYVRAIDPQRGGSCRSGHANCSALTLSFQLRSRTTTCLPISGRIYRDNGEGAVSTSAVPDENPDVSIVIPVYACAACIEPLLERTRAIVQQEGWMAEWVFVDDASPDDAWAILKELSSKDARIRGLRFDRNCGQHFAIYAGLGRARGRFSIVMDCDLEDPPEEISSLMARAHRGNDIVIATYFDRAHPAWRRFGSRLYFWMLGGANLDGARLSTYSVLSQRARSAFIAAPRPDGAMCRCCSGSAFRPPLSPVTRLPGRRAVPPTSSASCRFLLAVPVAI